MEAGRGRRGEGVAQRSERFLQARARTELRAPRTLLAACVPALMRGDAAAPLIVGGPWAAAACLPSCRVSGEPKPGWRGAAEAADVHQEGDLRLRRQAPHQIGFNAGRPGRPRGARAAHGLCHDGRGPRGSRSRPGRFEGPGRAQAAGRPASQAGKLPK